MVIEVHEILVKLKLLKFYQQKFIIAFAFAALIVVVSADVSHLSTKGPNGYHYPKVRNITFDLKRFYYMNFLKPEGPKLGSPGPLNDYLPPADEVAPVEPSNEYLPAADLPTNDYLPPSEDEAATTIANEV